MKKNLLLTSLLLALTCITSSATDLIRQRGCRVGTPNPHFTPRRASSLQDGNKPYLGNRHQLVILASFQDQDFAADHDATLQKWNMIFNAENYTEDEHVGSVHDYFLAQSYGQFNLTFDLLMLQLPDERYKYRSTATHDEYSQYMVDDIVDALQVQNIDWSRYDWDGDDFVDQLLIIYAGEGQNVSSDRNTIWPHQWWLSQHENLETSVPNDYRSYRTVTHDNKEYYIDCYCCVQEIVNIATTKTSFGTICHEYSHCFGFPDFYSTSGRVVGDWDIMDDGNYNGQGFRPCNYSAHERMLMGWLTPVELTAPTTITDMPALIDQPQAYLIRNDGAENEYYIIENRQQRGWDQDVPGSGIVIFHIDYDKGLWEGVAEYPNNNNVKRYTIFPANNNTKLSSNMDWSYPYVLKDSMGNDSIANDCLTNTSAPAATLIHENLDGELFMSKPITQIKVEANGLASFVFMGDPTTAIPSMPFMNHDSPLPPPPNTPDASWHSLDGRKLSGTPASRGVYIHGGRKVLF